MIKKVQKQQQSAEPAEPAESAELVPPKVPQSLSPVQPRTKAFTIPESLLENPELTSYYGTYSDMGVLKDSDMNRIFWILSKADNGFLYFALANYEQLTALATNLLKENYLKWLISEQEQGQGPEQLQEEQGQGSEQGLPQQQIQTKWSNVQTVKEQIEALTSASTKIKELINEQQQKLPTYAEKMATCQAKFASVSGQLGIRLSESVTDAKKEIIVSEVFPDSQTVFMTYKKGDEVYDTKFHVGDKILKFTYHKDDKKVDLHKGTLTLDSISEAIGSLKPDASVTMTVVHDGETREVTLKTNAEFIRWTAVTAVTAVTSVTSTKATNESEYDLKDICIWNGKQFVPRDLYLLEKIIDALERQVKTLEWYIKQIQDLPTLVAQSLVLVKQAQVRFSMLQVQNYKPRGLSTIGQYMDIKPITMVQEPYNPTKIALSQVNDPNEANANREMLKILDTMAELVEHIDKANDIHLKYYRDRATKAEVFCCHYRGQMELSNEAEVLAEYSVDGTYCKYCKEKIASIGEGELNGDAGWDDDGQKIQVTSGDIVEQPASEIKASSCTESFDLLRRVKETDINIQALEEQQLVVEDQLEFEDDINAIVEKRATIKGPELEQWVCYILDNLSKQGLYSIGNVMGAIISNYILTLQNPQLSLAQLLVANIDLADPRVEDRYQNLLSNYSKLPDQMKGPFEKIAPAEESVKKDMKRLQELQSQTGSEAEQAKIMDLIARRTEKIENPRNKIKQNIIIPLLKAQIFIDRYVYLISQAILQISTQYPQLMDTIIDRVRKNYRQTVTRMDAGI